MTDKKIEKMVDAIPVANTVGIEGFADKDARQKFIDAFEELRKYDIPDQKINEILVKIYIASIIEDRS